MFAPGEDVARALDASRSISLPEHHEVLHIIPRGFSIDGQEGVKDPEGMSAVRLEVTTHIVHGGATALQNLTRNRTTLVIAHRLSTITDADNILVMDHAANVKGFLGRLSRPDGRRICDPVDPGRRPVLCRPSERG